MNTELVSQANAKKIEEVIKLKGGTIDSDGCIEGNFGLCTTTINTWINEFKADFWVLNEQLRISNWPQSVQSKTQFKVTVPCGTSKETVKNTLKSVLSNVEVDEDEDDC